MPPLGVPGPGLGQQAGRRQRGPVQPDLLPVGGADGSPGKGGGPRASRSRPLGTDQGRIAAVICACDRGGGGHKEGWDARSAPKVAPTDVARGRRE